MSQAYSYLNQRITFPDPGAEFARGEAASIIAAVRQDDDGLTRPARFLQFLQAKGDCIEQCRAATRDRLTKSRHNLRRIGRPGLSQSHIIIEFDQAELVV